MGDTIEGLSIELEKQKQTNSKLADLLLMIERTLPDPDGRVSATRLEVRRTKEVLDNAEQMLAAKR